MSWFDRFRRPPPAPPVAPRPRVAPTPSRPPIPAELELLRDLDVGVDVSDALDALRTLMGGSHERAALTALTQAHAKGVLPPVLATLGAQIHERRGESDRALHLLDDPRGVDALLLAADLWSERGETARALTLVERALALDIDAPGAEERHRRWSGSLGVGMATPAAHGKDTTMLTASAPETSFRLVGEAGRGGAGAVFEAVDDSLSRRVALKVYHEPERDRDKLVREASTAVSFRGRGVVRVFDVEPERGLIVMEWLPAGALKRWLARGDAEFLWPLERWLIPLARALARVHDAGWVHGDIKPANVLFRTAAEPILSDFGLAHRAGEQAGGGSRGYLSPERIAGAALTPADDVYALGRLMEDALGALATRRREGSADHRLRAVSRQCLQPADRRPPDATAFIALLQSEVAAPV